MAPEPGWYIDPDNAELLRWWDGSAWTDHRRPATGTASQMAAPTPDSGQNPDTTVPDPPQPPAAPPPPPPGFPQTSPAPGSAPPPPKSGSNRSAILLLAGIGIALLIGIVAVVAVVAIVLPSNEPQTFAEACEAVDINRLEQALDDEDDIGSVYLVEDSSEASRLAAAYGVVFDAALLLSKGLIREEGDSDLEEQLPELERSIVDVKRELAEWSRDPDGYDPEKVDELDGSELDFPFLNFDAALDSTPECDELNEVLNS